MRNLHEPTGTDRDDALVQAVEGVLARICSESGQAAPGPADDFAFSVALNALVSVLEVVRCDRPDQLEAYRDIVRLALQD